MIKTTSKTNVIPNGGAYPFGNIKDDDGTFNGTPLDSELFADYIQFFEKMFSASSLVANGLSDNNTNGFQLFEALEDISTEIKYRGAVGYTNSTALLSDMDEFTPGLAEFTSLRKIIDIVLPSWTGQRIVSLGDALVGTEIFIHMSSLGVSFPRFVINGTSLGVGQQIRKKGVTVNDTDYLSVAGDVLHFVKISTHWQLSLMS